MLNTISEMFGYFSRNTEHGLKTLYIALVLLSLHFSLVVHLNSSFLAQFVTDSQISILFTIGSLFSLPTFLYMSYFLRRFGNYKLTILFTLLEFVALLGMALSTNAFFAIFFFLLHFIAVPLILLNLDVFIEAIIGSQEKKTGSTRGLYLVVLSLAGALAPLLSGHLITQNAEQSFTPAYIASALMLVPFMGIIVLYFKNFKDPNYPKQSASRLLRIFSKEKDVRNVFIAHFHLQFFFTWMTIYTPLYLAKVAGFNWTEIGYIIFVALCAYVIFEYPIGVIADKYIGEKEMMAFGFLIIAVSTSWLAFLPHSNIVVWMIAMFFTRVGAAFVEATTESYFFKQTKGGDSDKISLFRMTRPLSFTVGAFAGSVLLLHVEFSFLFIILGLLMVPGIFFTLLLKDTK
jgi:MFS family permease